MMKSSYLGQRNHLSHVPSIYPPVLGRILPESEMGSRAVVVSAVARNDPAEMALVQDDDVVEALSRQTTFVEGTRASSNEQKASETETAI